MIIAVDFDGVLCENRFPHIGPPIDSNIELVRALVIAGHEVVLWTSRVGQPLEDAVKWCEEHNLHFCAVNDSAPSNVKQYEGMYTEKPRKIYADVYIDDHSVGYNPVTLKADTIDSLYRRLIDEQRKNDSAGWWPVRLRG